MKRLIKSTLIIFLICNLTLCNSEIVENIVYNLRTTYEPLLTDNEWEEALVKEKVRVAIYFIFHKAKPKKFFFSQKKKLQEALMDQCQSIYNEYFSLTD